MNRENICKLTYENEYSSEVELNANEEDHRVYGIHCVFDT